MGGGAGLSQIGMHASRHTDMDTDTHHHSLLLLLFELLEHGLEVVDKVVGVKGGVPKRAALRGIENAAALVVRATRLH